MIDDVCLALNSERKHIINFVIFFKISNDAVEHKSLYEIRFSLLFLYLEFFTVLISEEAAKHK